VNVKLPVPPLPAGRPRLVVTGFMGTGKTTSGSAAASRLGLPFFDLDRVLEARAGMSISALFDERGEEGLRLVEGRALADAARLSGTVVATGGGAVTGERWDALAAGSEVAVLTAEPAELLRRLDGVGDRPLLDGDVEERMYELLRRRAPAYAGAGRPLDTTRLTIDEVGAELALRYLAASGRTVRIAVRTPDGERPFVLGHGALDCLGEELGAVLPDCRAAVLVFDPSVREAAGRAGDSLRAAGIDVLGSIPLPSGEAAKDPATLAALWAAFAEAGLERTGAIVAVGGGAALDAAGFAAATFARGVALVNVPTTVLAMVDASLGGKVALDHAGVKNLAGAFHHPQLVVADPSVLASLPERAYRAGLAEAAKAFMLASPLALEAIPSLQLDDPTSADLVWAMEQAVRIKAAYVAEDPFDRGVRHALNLGHTFAHALESATGYGMLHGEAVAVGLVAAARLGVARGSSPAGLPDRYAAALATLGLPVEPPDGLDPDALVGAMGADKKRAGGRLRFVLPAEDGAELVDDVTAEIALDALFDRTLPPKEA
jgi:shikimate kinase / 3-dehydroquinate synthase